MAIIDDNYVLGPLEVIFLANHDAFAEDLKEVGLKLQPTKSKFYVDEAHRNEKWDRLRGSIPNSTITNPNGAEHHGFTGCDVPIKQREFVTEYLRQKKGSILKGYEKISSLMDPRRWPHPEIGLLVHRGPKHMA